MDQMLALLLTLALCNGLGLIVYSGIFAFSFKRKSKFVLRLLLSVIGIGGICTGLAFALHAGLSYGGEIDIKTVEIARIISNIIIIVVVIIIVIIYIIICKFFNNSSISSFLSSSSRELVSSKR